MAATRERLKMRLYEEEAAPETIIARYGLDPAQVIDFSVNVNPFAPPPIAAGTAEMALEACGVYPDLNLQDLRAALAQRHGLDTGAFLFGAGLDDVLKLISQAWLGPAKTALIHVPTFPRYELEARIVGARQVFVSASEPWHIDMAGIEAALAAEPVDVAYLCTPNNPTGARISNADIARLADAFPGTRFVVDEALSDPAQPGAMPLVAAHENIVVLRTFSKYFGLAGLRVGYAAGQPRTLASLKTVRPPFNVSGFSARIALATLKNDDFLSTSRQAFASERAFVTSGIEALPGLTLRGACSNTVFVTLEGIPLPELITGLAREGIIVVDATSFRGLEDTPSLRLSLRTRKENTRLLEALSRVSRALC